MRASATLAKHRKLRRRRGTALIMVLLAIVVLTVFLTEVQQETASGLASAIAARDRLKAEYHARSAINLARMLIATEPTVRRAIAPMLIMLTGGKGKPPQIPVWEFADQVLGIYNGKDGATDFGELAGVDPEAAENVGLGTDGHFALVIVDEDSKINANIAARGDTFSAMQIASQLMGLMVGPQYDPLFDGLDADGQTSDRATICGAIIDWADWNEERESCALSSQATAAGAEDNFYQTIGLDYFRKNAAFDSLEELRLVRGMSDDFWGTFVDPDPRNPKKRIMTVWGQGKINVNSANAQTLWALVCGPTGAPDAPLCIDPLQAASFMSAVSMVRSFTMGAPLFGSAKDFVATMKGGGMLGPFLTMAGVQPVQAFKSEDHLRKMITTKSKMFSIYAEGVVPSRHRETRVSIHAVIDFRNAMDMSKVAPGGLAAMLGGGGESSSGSAGASSRPGSGAGDLSSLDPAGLMAALLSNPAGNIVYWRVQ